MALSARQKQAALRNQIVRIEAEIVSLQEAADAEPELFDGAAVVVGSNVIIRVGNGDKATEVQAQVLAVKKNEPGVKGPGTLIKVQTGEGFETETRIVYPAQVLRYAEVKTA